MIIAPKSVYFPEKIHLYVPQNENFPKMICPLSSIVASQMYAFLSSNSPVCQNKGSEIANLEFEAHENVHKSVFLATERVGIKICWMISQLWGVRSCPTSFGCEEKILYKQHIVHCTVSTVFFKVVVLVIWLPFVPIRKGQTLPIGLKHPGSFGMAICYAQPKLNFPRCESSSAYFGFYWRILFLRVDLN